MIDRIRNLTCQDLKVDLRLVDGSLFSLDDKFLISAICYGSFYGSGFNPAPDAKFDDGILNYIVAYKFPKWQLLPLILKYKRGKHQSSSYLDEFKALSGEIRSDKEFLANIDGEIFRDTLIRFEVRPGALSWAYFKNNGPLLQNR